MLPCADSVRGTSDCAPVSQLERTRGLHCSLSWLRTILSVLRACELTSLLNSPPFFFSSRDPDKYPSFNEGSENGSDFDSEGERTSAGAHRVDKPPLYVLLAADSPSLASLVFRGFLLDSIGMLWKAAVAAGRFSPAQALHAGGAGIRFPVLFFLLSLIF